MSHALYENITPKNLISTEWKPGSCDTVFVLFTTDVMLLHMFEMELIDCSKETRASNRVSIAFPDLFCNVKAARYGPLAEMPSNSGKRNSIVEYEKKVEGMIA